MRSCVCDASAGDQPVRPCPPICLKDRIRAFLRREDGSITAFMLVSLLTMVFVAGMAIDYMRHETVRAELQYGLDRGILAAASFEQTMDPETTVRDYIRSAAYLDETVQVNVVPTITPSTRRIDATARYTLDTIFLRMVGIPTLDVVAQGSAMDGRGGIEISLVLDVSGTMAWEGRLPALIPAAQGFVNQVLTDDTKDRTTINLVPYAGNVNPGPALFAALGGERFHTHSSCLEMTSDDYAHEGLPAAGYYRQVPHFHWWAIAENQEAYMDIGWCPSDASMAIELMSNDSVLLNQRIQNLRLHDGTGTHVGMKWGLALLDPDSNPTISGLVEPAFSTRPASWEDTDTMKFIVLMTDGKISSQERPAPPYEIDVDPSPIDGSYDARQYKSDRTVNRDDFFAQCDLAKQKGVTVFTIAFMVPSNLEWEMRDCASSPGHFYSVSGLNIAEAFDSIAATIQNLKLVN